MGFAGQLSDVQIPWWALLIALCIGYFVGWLEGRYGKHGRHDTHGHGGH